MMDKCIIDADVHIGSTWEGKVMDTIFKITLTQTNGSEWDINLGADILDGLSQSVKEDYATAHAVVVIQNDSKLALRHAEDGEQLVAALQGQYPDVTATPHVKAPPKPRAKMTEPEALAKALGIPVSRVTPELLAAAKALVA